MKAAGLWIAGLYLALVALAVVGLVASKIDVLSSDALQLHDAAAQKWTRIRHVQQGSTQDTTLTTHLSSGVQ